MKIKKTNRGFVLYEFTDRYNFECSLQKSSLATEDCIWLGINEPKAKVLVRNEGWKDYELPTGVELFGGRMHLTKEHVKELLPLLQKFVETGDI